MSSGYHFTAYPDGTLTCRLGHRVPPGKVGEHMHQPRNNNRRDTAMSFLLAHITERTTCHDVRPERRTPAS